MATKPWEKPISGSMFGGSSSSSSPSFDFGNIGYDPNFKLDFDVPSITNNSIQAGWNIASNPEYNWSSGQNFNYSVPGITSPFNTSRESTDWDGIGKGITKALGYANQWKAGSGSRSGQSGYGGQSSGVIPGSNERSTRLTPSVTLIEGGRGDVVQEQTQQGKKGGTFGAIGSIAGPLLAATPFFGPLAVPIAAGVGMGLDAIV